MTGVTALWLRRLRFFAFELCRLGTAIPYFLSRPGGLRELENFAMPFASARRTGEAKATGIKPQHPRRKSANERDMLREASLPCQGIENRF